MDSSSAQLAVVPWHMSIHKAKVFLQELTGFEWKKDFDIHKALMLLVVDKISGLGDIYASNVPEELIYCIPGFQKAQNKLNFVCFSMAFGLRLHDHRSTLQEMGIEISLKTWKDVVADVEDFIKKCYGVFVWPIGTLSLNPDKNIVTAIQGKLDKHRVTKDMKRRIYAKDIFDGMAKTLDVVGSTITSKLESYLANHPVFKHKSIPKNHVFAFTFEQGKKMKMAPWCQEIDRKSVV